MSTFKELIRQVKSEIREVSATRRARTAAGEPCSWTCGRRTSGRRATCPGPCFIPRGFLELRIEEKVPDKRSEVVVYCAGGTRSALGRAHAAGPRLRHVVSMAGGFGRWKEAGLQRSWCRATLSAEQKERYSRHMKVPEVGEAGQLQLLESKVLLVGAGGLGCPAGALPGGGGGGDDRHRRLRRGGPLEPAAPDPAHERLGGHAQDGVGGGAASGRSTRT